MGRIVITRLARQDLFAIRRFIASDSPARALSYIGDIERHCDFLAIHPYAGSSREELGAGIRLLPFR